MVNREEKRAALKAFLQESAESEVDEIELEDVVLRICVESKTYSVSHTWIAYKTIKQAAKDVILKQLSKSLGSDFGGKRCSVDVRFPKYVTNPGVVVEGQAEVVLGDCAFLVPVRLEFTVSPKYSKKGSTYFEGKLQLRNPSKELLEFVQHDIKKNESKGVFVNKVVPLKNGVDYYLTKNSYLRSIGKKLKKQFKGELKETTKLFTRNKQTSRDVYRATVMFRLD